MQYVKQLIADGYVGKVLSTSLIASGMAWGGMSPAADAYVNDINNGATMLTIPFSHTIEAVCGALGEFQSLNAVISNNFKEATVIETGEKIPKSAEDQLIIGGLLESGTPISLHYRGGVSLGTNFLWDINGTDGDLLLTGPGGHTQFMEPSLRGGKRGDKHLADMPVPDTYRWVSDEVPPGPPLNVAQTYFRLAEDLKKGTCQVATFQDAVARHRLIECIRAAANTGANQNI